MKGTPSSKARLPKPGDGRARALFAAMRAHGWTSVAGKRHPKAIGPNGEELTLSGTPSDRNYVDAIMRNLRKLGFRCDQ